MYQPSFWEKSTFFTDLDVCIIGSGITGLCASIFMKQIAPDLNVLVVDGGFLPYGASTRNAGFACFGSMTELMSDLKTENETIVFDRLAMRWHGLQKLRALAGDTHIGYEPLGGYEIFTEKETEIIQQVTDRMDYFNEKLKEITGITQMYANASSDKFGFKGITHSVLNKGEGQIDTGKMMMRLSFLAQQHGVKIISGLKIDKLENRSDHAEVFCANGFNFNSAKCLIATNGFAKSLIPELNVEPARAQVLITQPIPNLAVKGSFHYKEGYYYFRNVGDRLLLGGGRNLDFEGEHTTEFAVTRNIQNRLDSMLRDIILPGQQFEVDMRWSGIMGLGDSKSTILKKVDGNLYCAVRMGGMGVAIGAHIGEQAAQLVVNGTIG